MCWSGSCSSGPCVRRTFSKVSLDFLAGLYRTMLWGGVGRKKYWGADVRGFGWGVLAVPGVRMPSGISRHPISKHAADRFVPSGYAQVFCADLWANLGCITTYTLYRSCIFSSKLKSQYYEYMRTHISKAVGEKSDRNFNQPINPYHHFSRTLWRDLGLETRDPHRLPYRLRSGTVRWGIPTFSHHYFFWNFDRFLDRLLARCLARFLTRPLAICSFIF